MPSDVLGRMTPRQLSQALPGSDSPHMRHRRWIAGLSLLSSAVMGGIGLFQLGIVRSLPEPKWGPFDMRKVNRSPQAYSILKTPDALLGAASYAVTACLAGCSDPERSRTAPWVPLGMGIKLAADAAFAGKLTLEEWSRYRALCFWCLVSAGATFAAAALGTGEVLAAARILLDGRRTPFAVKN